MFMISMPSSFKFLFNLTRVEVVETRRLKWRNRTQIVDYRFPYILYLLTCRTWVFQTRLCCRKNSQASDFSNLFSLEILWKNYNIIQSTLSIFICDKFVKRALYKKLCKIRMDFSCTFDFFLNTIMPYCHWYD